MISSKLDEKDGIAQREEEMAERYLNEGFSGGSGKNAMKSSIDIWNNICPLIEIDSGWISMLLGRI